MHGQLQAVVDKLEGWLEYLIELLPNIAVAVIVIGVAVVVGRLLGAVTTRVLRRTTDNKSVVGLLRTAVVMSVVLLGFFIALGVLQLDKTVTSLLAGAGIVGLALGFAFQDAAANLVSGVLLSVRRPFAIGELIESNDYLGIVVDLNLRSTIVRTLDGKRVILPNKDVFQSPIVNMTREPRLRVDVSCGVSYGDDLGAAEKAVVEALEDVPGREEGKPVELFWEGFGASSIDFVARIWIRYDSNADFMKARSEMVRRIKTALAEAGVTIPFPIRTLDFGIKGGEKLSAMLVDRDPGSGAQGNA